MINDGTYEFGDPTVMWLRMSRDSSVSMTEIVGRPTEARLLLLRILNEELRATKFWITCGTKNSLGVFFTKMRTCFSKEGKLSTNQSNKCFSGEKQCVYRGRGVC